MSKSKNCRDNTFVIFFNGLKIKGILYILKDINLIPGRKKRRFKRILTRFLPVLTRLSTFLRIENELKRNETGLEISLNAQRNKTSLKGIKKLEIILFIFLLPRFN